MDDRCVTGRVAVEELPQIVRAIGFYPSEDEIANMVNEVRYRHFMHDGILEEDIDLMGLIKLYLNHRPVVPLTSVSIEGAFDEVRVALGAEAAGVDGTQVAHDCLHSSTHTPFMSPPLLTHHHHHPLFIPRSPMRL